MKVAPKIKLIVLDFDQAIIEQNLYEILTKEYNLPYAYNRLKQTDLLCNKENNSFLNNSSYSYSLMENLIDKLFENKQLTVKNVDSFKTNIEQLQKQGIIVAVATRSSRIDEIDYILQKVLGKNHNIVIVGGGGQITQGKQAHLEKIIEVANINNPNPIKISETILIDDKATIINNTIGKEQEHCFGIQIKPGCINTGIGLASHYVQTGETTCPENDSIFYSEFSWELAGQESIQNL